MKNSFLISIIIILSLLVVSLGGYIIYDKFITNNNVEEKEYGNDNEPTQSEAKNIAQSLYETAYNIIEEGTGLVENYYNNAFVVKKQYNNEVLNCWEMNFSLLNNIFTENALTYIKNNFSDKFNGDNKYYACENTYTFFSKSENFIDTIFGITDQGERNLKIALVADNSIKATGQLEACTDGFCSVSGDKKPLNITFKKINDIWQIDTFE